MPGVPWISSSASSARAVGFAVSTSDSVPLFPDADRPEPS